MDEPPDLGSINEFKKVPEVFWSFEAEGPFRKCVACGADLYKPGTQYLIEKALKGDEVIFEYAMCMKCRENFEAELSQQSRKLINHYFMEHADFASRREELLKTARMDERGWLSKCLIKKRPPKPGEEYQIITLCEDEDMLFTYMPFMLCGEAIEELQGLLSEQTTGSIDRFTGDYLGLPGMSTNPKVFVF